MVRTVLLSPAIMSGQMHFVLHIFLSITCLGFWLVTHQVIPGSGAAMPTNSPLTAPH